MSVQSVQGRGSTFSFTSVHDVPTKAELVKFLRSTSVQSAQKDALPGARQFENTMSTAPSFRKVCVAEDNPINLKHLSKNLSVLGYQQVLCTNGKEALDKFTEPGSDIDAVIVDMSMPIMDGLEATRLMREFEAAHATRIRTPIIALSGNALKDQVDQAMVAGTSDYLVKPCKRADLARTLKYWEHVVHTGAPHQRSQP
ncbi:hypothetical protein H2203_008129 [Taxawa tesnikishii (nom. ined.)]|nr:hypothetical protein H2203_008129 [Dothideales sp. JES 119]